MHIQYLAGSLKQKRHGFSTSLVLKGPIKWIVHRDPVPGRGGRSSFYAIWLTIGSIRLQKVPSSWEYGGFSWGEWSNTPFHWNILAFHVSFCAKSIKLSATFFSAFGALRKMQQNMKEWAKDQNIQAFIESPGCVAYQNQ